MISSIRLSYASLADLPTNSAGAADHWLSPTECQAWHQMRSPERRTTWLAGRIVAKRLLRTYLADAGHDLPPASAAIHIESTDGGQGQRPRVFVAGRPLDWALSIAHTARGALVAICSEPCVTLGVDLVCPEDLEDQRLSWCFTAAERRWLAGRATHAGAREQLWAMKEALYKACHQGEGFAPRQIEVVPEPCYPMLASTRAVRIVQGWRVEGQFAALAVVEPRHESIRLATHQPSEPSFIC